MCKTLEITFYLHSTDIIEDIIFALFKYKYSYVVLCTENHEPKRIVNRFENIHKSTFSKIPFTKLYTFSYKRVKLKAQEVEGKKKFELHCKEFTFFLFEFFSSSRIFCCFT